MNMESSGRKIQILILDLLEILQVQLWGISNNCLTEGNHLVLFKPLLADLNL